MRRRPKPFDRDQQLTTMRDRLSDWYFDRPAEQRASFLADLAQIVHELPEFIQVCEDEIRREAEDDAALGDLPVAYQRNLPPLL